MAFLRIFAAVLHSDFSTFFFLNRHVRCSSDKSWPKIMPSSMNSDQNGLPYGVPKLPTMVKSQLESKKLANSN